MGKLISLTRYREALSQVELDREVGRFWEAIAAGDLNQAFQIMEQVRLLKQKAKPSATDAPS